MSVKDKRVLVTGADGFIGSHLVEELIRAGARVRALSQYNSFNNWGWLETIHDLEKANVVTGDIRDPHFCLGLVQGIQIVFHLAALIPIPYSYEAPASYVDTNISGTLNLCRAALPAGVERFIQTSTSEVYGTARYVPIDESHPLTPQSPYSASKIGSDAIAGSFYYSFGLPVVIARPFNTYGPRQSARAVIPTIITQLAGGTRVLSLGDISTTRDFTFVKDTCRGFMALAEMKGGEGDVFNIGTDSEISVKDLATMIGRLMNREFEFHIDAQRIRPEKSEVHRLRCANGKLFKACGFKPATSLDDGLTETVQWFTSGQNLRHYKETIYNV